MNTRIFGILAFAAIIALSFDSCTKTITETKEVTVIDTVHDTIHQPALLRFLSMFPDSVPGLIIVSSTRDNSSRFMSAGNTCSGEYFPLRPDTSILCYLSNSNLPGWLDSVPVTALGTTMNTYALFLDASTNGVKYYRSVDSEKLKAAPPGYCYLRFIDGIQDPQGPPEFYLDLDYAGNCPFRSGTQAKPTSWGEISPYVLIRTGSRKVLLRTPIGDTSLSTFQEFQEGSYYTARATGAHNNDKFAIDLE